MSRRLTKDDKSRIIEQIDESAIEHTAHLVSAEDGREFNEGLAAGLLLAVEVIGKNTSIGAVSALNIMVLAASCIRAAENNNT